jgi:hypothetical protein
MPILGVIASSTKGAPGIPTIGTATNVGTGRAYNNGSATVTFTAGAGAAATSFTATSSPGGFTATGASSPLTVTGLQSSTSYTFTVTGTNASGTSAASSASNSITATTVPQAPTIGTATGGSSSASVAFTAGATGGSAITTFTATSSPSSITGTGASSPVTVSGLTNGTSYTFTVTATNANGTSTASAASNSVTPAIPALTAWSLVGNYPSTSSYPASASGGGYIWNAGGRTPTVLSSAYRSTDGVTWSDLGAMPAARWQPGGAYDGTRFQVFGGYDSSNTDQSTTYSWNGSWSTGTALPFIGSGMVGWSQGSGVGVNGTWTGTGAGTNYYRTGTGAWSTGTTLPVTTAGSFWDGFSFGAITNTNDRSVAWAARPRQVVSPDAYPAGWSLSSLGGTWSQFGVNLAINGGNRFGGAIANGFQFLWAGDAGGTNTSRNNGSSWSTQSAFPRAQMQGGSGQIGANIFSWVGEGPQFTYRSDVYRATQN